MAGEPRCHVGVKSGATAGGKEDRGDGNVRPATTSHPFPPSGELSPPWHEPPLPPPAAGRPRSQHSCPRPAISTPRGPRQRGTGATKPPSAPPQDKPSPKPVHKWIEGGCFARRIKTTQSQWEGQAHPQYPRSLGGRSQGSQTSLEGRKTPDQTPQRQRRRLSSAAAGRYQGLLGSPSPAQPLASSPAVSPASAGRCLGRCSVAPACGTQLCVPLWGFFLGPGHTLHSDLFCFAGATGTFKQPNEMQLLEQPQLSLFV